MTFTHEELLNDLYYKQHNYDGAQQLYNKAKAIDKTIKIDTVKEWLKKQQNKQMTFRKVGRREFLPIYSEAPYSFQIDLTFFPRYKTKNDGYDVLFTAININTRYAYAYKAKDKRMDTIRDIMEQMENKTDINAITADEGLEFKNREFKEYCDDNNIELYLVKGDSHKLGIINRFHRTIKEKLTKYFIANDTTRWIDVIDKIIHNYNHTVNRGIGIEPYRVNSRLEHEIIVWKRAQTEIFHNKSEKIEKGDKVRIINKRILFEDKMLPNYSNEVYEVIRPMKNSCIVDIDGDEVEIKNSQLLKVNEVENKRTLKEIPAILNEAKASNRNRRAGVSTDNVITETRTRKRNTKYDS